jgi:hypothetical protein
MKKQHTRLVLAILLATSSISLISFSPFHLALSPAQAQAARTRVSVNASFDTNNRTPQVVQASVSFISDGSGKDIRGSIQFSQDVPRNVNPPRLRSISTTSIATASRELTPNRVILRGEALQAYAGVSGCSYRGTVEIILRDTHPHTGSRRLEDSFRVVFTPTSNQQIPRQCIRENALPKSEEWVGRGDIQINVQNVR